MCPSPTCKRAELTAFGSYLLNTKWFTRLFFFWVYLPVWLFISQRVMELISVALDNPLSPAEDNSEQKVGCSFSHWWNAVKRKSKLKSWDVNNFSEIYRIDVAGSWSSQVRHECGPPGWSGLSASDIGGYEGCQRSAGNFTNWYLLYAFFMFRNDLCWFNL